jgi:hypothetical protein
LVFASLTPATGARINRNRLELAPTHFSTSDVHWNFEDNALLRAIARSGRVRTSLIARLAAARRRLHAAGKQKIAEFYKDTEIDKAILNAALDRNPGRSVFRSLFLVEREIVTQARAAALKMAAFHTHRDAARARRDLAEFGLKVTDTFNEELANIAVGDALRPLGALMFITAAQALDPTLAARASAMLNIIDVRDDVRFPPDGFPNHDPVAEADITLLSRGRAHARGNEITIYRPWVVERHRFAKPDLGGHRVRIDDP